MTTIRKYSWLFIVTLGFAMMGMQINQFGMMVHELSGNLNIQISSMVFYDAIPLMVSLPISLRYSQLLGNRTNFSVLRIALTLFAIGDLLLFSLLKTDHLTIVAYIAIEILFGIGIGLIYPALNDTILQQPWQSKKKSSVLAIVNVFWNVGFFSSALLFGWLATKVNWMYSPLFISAGFAIALLITQYTPHNFRHCENTPTELQNQSWQRDLLRNPLILFLGISLFITTYSQNTVEYWFPVFLEVRRHVSVMNAAYVMSFFGISQAAGRLIFGLVVLPKVKPNRYIIVASLLFIFGMIAFVLVETMPHFIALIIIIGLASSCLLPVTMSYASSMTSAYNNTFTGYMIFMNSCGPFVSLLFSSFLADIINKQIAISSAPLLLLISVVIVFFVSLYRRRAKYI